MLQWDEVQPERISLCSPVYPGFGEGQRQRSIRGEKNQRVHNTCHIWSVISSSHLIPINLDHGHDLGGTFRFG